jgi:Fe(3+) dicitrate transport protein
MKMLRFALVVCAAFLFLFLSAFRSALAQSSTGVIEGQVVEDGLNAPLPGANVYVEGESIGAATAADGSFTLTGVEPGTYTLTASVLGYETARQTVTVEPGATARVTFRLAERPVEISELIVERVMLTGGRSGIDEIPGAAHYIGPRELETFSYNNVHRVLQGVPGVYLQEEDGYGLRPNIGLRGTGTERSSKITVMEDGVLAAPAPYAAPSAYYFPTIGRMQGVEVRKGSSQIKYGPYTTGGALNLISTQIPAEFAGRVNVLAGSDQERTLHAFVGDSYENVGFLAETYQARTEGFKTLTGFANANAGLDYSTGFDKQDYLAKLRVNTDRDAAVYQALTVKLSQTEETSNETYLGLTEADFATQPLARYAGSQEDVMNTEHRQIQARHFIRPARFIDITTTAYRNDFQRNWFKLDDVRASADGDDVGIGAILANPATYADELAIIKGQPSPNDNALEVKNNNREYYSQGVQSVVGLQFETSGLAHEIEIGGRLHEDEIDRFQWINTYSMEEGGVMQLTRAGTPGTESNRVTAAQALATYVQYRLTAGDLQVVPGLRYETITIERTEYATDTPAGRNRTAAPIASRENSVDVLMPGIGVDYQFTDALSSFAGVHKGFAPPGSSPDTDPEESINYEVGARYRASGLRLESVFFFNDYTNLLGRDLAAIGGDPTGEQFNGGDVDVLGVELSAGHDFGLTTGTQFSIPAELAYTYTSATFQTAFESDYDPWGTVAEGDELPYVPPHQLAIRLGIDGLYGFGVTLSSKYVSSMRTVAGQGDIADGQSIDGHTVLDVASNYDVTRWATVFASVQNLTDNTYAVARRPAGLRPGLPRTFRLGVKATF